MPPKKYVKKRVIYNKIIESYVRHGQLVDVSHWPKDETWGDSLVSVFLVLGHYIDSDIHYIISLNWRKLSIILTVKFQGNLHILYNVR